MNAIPLAVETASNRGKALLNGDKLLLVSRGSSGLLKRKKKNRLKILDFLSTVLVNIKMTLLRERPRFARAREIWKPSFIYTVRPTIHTNLSRKWSLFESNLQTGGIWKSRLFVDGKHLKTRENVGVDFPH